MLGLSGPISSENALTLADILRRTVVIEWFEGVALVRRSSIASTRHPRPRCPSCTRSSPPSGRVDVNGGSSTDEPVRRLGQLLQATFGLIHRCSCG